jgi:transcriptional regulator with XRE-family HTH domain
MTAAIVELGPGGGRDVDRRLGARLRERRIALGLTQQQVAELVGISHQQSRKYEAGANRISVGRLVALARALGVEVGYFLEGLGTDEPLRLTARQRQALELARDFAALPRQQQEALAELVRTLAGAGTDAA